MKEEEVLCVTRDVRMRVDSRLFEAWGQVEKVLGEEGRRHLSDSCLMLANWTVQEVSGDCLSPSTDHLRPF